MLKKIFSVSLILALGACSSTKTAEVEEETTETVQTETAAADEKVVEEVKTTTEEVIDEVKTSDSTAEVASKIVCSLGTDQRSVEVVKTGATSCDVNYSKFGEQNKIAWAEFQPNYCSGVQDKVKGNLEGAGFSCANE